MWFKHLMASFPPALRGIRRTIRRERNLRVHLTAVVYVIWAGKLAGLEPVQWAVLCLCFGLVTSLELVNTAIERLSDRVSREWDPLIGAAKDAAAGAVLLGAAASVGVAVFLFGPWIASGGLGRLIRTSPAFDGAFISSLVLAIAWIAWEPKEGKRDDD